MAVVKTGADAIRAALKSGTTEAAVKKFGKRPVYQVLRRDQAAFCVFSHRLFASVQTKAWNRLDDRTTET